MANKSNKEVEEEIHFVEVDNQEVVEAEYEDASEAELKNKIAEEKAKQYKPDEEEALDNIIAREERKLSNNGNEASEGYYEELNTDYGYLIPFLESGSMNKQIELLEKNKSPEANKGNIFIISDDSILRKDFVSAYLGSNSELLGGKELKVAEITASKLNRQFMTFIHNLNEKDVLIVYEVEFMKEIVLKEFVQYLESRQNPLQVLIIDSYSAIENLKSKFGGLEKVFNISLQLKIKEKLDVQKYAHEYAYEKGYGIDVLGGLAIVTQIGLLENANDSKKKNEIKKLIDKAIKKASKKSFSNYIDIVLGRRYDENDMVIIKEEDF